MISVIDQIGNEIKLPLSPTRIVSIVPSLSETLEDIGLIDSIVGVTKFCIHPRLLRSKATIIGGTKNPQIQKIIELKPDIVFANKEENNLTDVALLAAHVPIYVTDIKTIKDTLSWLSDLKTIFSAKDQVIQRWIHKIQKIDQSISKNSISKVLYLIWRDPFMSVGRDTFIHHMMAHYGFQNLLEKKERYPVLSSLEIREMNPSFIFLSSEPYPFKEMHIAELQQMLPNTRIILVDGELFSWYGTRLIKSHEYLCQLVKQLENISFS